MDVQYKKPHCPTCGATMGLSYSTSKPTCGPCSMAIPPARGGENLNTLNDIKSTRVKDDGKGINDFMRRFNRIFKRKVR